METQIVSKITTVSLEALDNSAITNNNIAGSDSVASIAAGFKVLNTDRQTYTLDATTGAAFTKTIDTSNASFIHIQCNKYVATPADRPDPRRLHFVYAGQNIGNMSQFQVINCDAIASLVISNVVVPAGEKAILTIIKGVYAQ
jgi:hypothetical protein